VTPRKRPRSTGRAPISGPLRDAITTRRLTAYALGKSTGLDARAIGRWLNGEKDLALSSADRLAAALGVRLTGAGDRRRGRELPELAADLDQVVALPIPITSFPILPELHDHGSQGPDPCPEPTA
jgi:transcriptional regulator with XRE-family HTH domain